METLSQTASTSTTEWAKTINPKDMAYDDQGRIVIRLPVAENRRCQHHAYRIKPRHLSNKLLHPTDRVINRPIAEWVQFLLNKFQQASSSNAKEEDRKMQMRQLAEVYNNAALIFFSLDDIAKARELCYSEIHLFMKEFTQYRFQPWINLSRMDRVLGQFDEALQKLQPLEQVNYDLLAEEDKEIAAAVRTCSLLEPVKIYLQMRDYSKLESFLQANQKIFLDKHFSFLYETALIKLVNQNKVDEAVELLHFAKRAVSPVALPVFFLREYEMYRDPSLLKNLFAYAVNGLKADSASSNAILFALHLVDILQKESHKDLARSLIYTTLSLSKKIHDELLISECFVRLYRLTKSVHERMDIEESMKSLYQKTHYANARKKLLKFCPMLSTIKTPNLCPGLEELYQKLTAYAHSF